MCSEEVPISKVKDSLCVSFFWNPQQIKISSLQRAGEMCGWAPALLSLCGLVSDDDEGPHLHIGLVFKKSVTARVHGRGTNNGRPPKHRSATFVCVGTCQRVFKFRELKLNWLKKSLQPD